MQNHTKKYNGWENYDTWNVALWINNSEALHFRAQQADNYAEFAGKLFALGIEQTPDGVPWVNFTLDILALNELIEEIKK